MSSSSSSQSESSQKPNTRKLTRGQGQRSIKSSLSAAEGPIGEQQSQPAQKLSLQQKYIVFVNRQTNKIYAKIPMPKQIMLNKNLLCRLDNIRSRLRMLYIDVLCRGYHPVRGFQMSVTNVFSTENAQQIDETKKQDQLIEESVSKSQTVNKSKSTNKIGPKSKQTKQQAYSYFISNNQAIGTIWRCLSRQIGKPLKDYNIDKVQQQLYKQLQKMKKQSQFSSNQSQYQNDKQKMRRYSQLEQNVQKIRDKIVKTMKDIKNKYEISQNQLINPKQTIAKCMRKQILEMELTIFLKTLICIREKSNTSLVELVLEQPYPQIQLSKNKAKQLLGLDVYNQKVEWYQIFKDKCELEGKKIIVCHRCLTPLNHISSYAQCSNQSAHGKVGHTLLTNPYIYCKQVINENRWQMPSLEQKYIHPYLIYYRVSDQNGQYLCNRSFCSKCETAEATRYIQQNCLYCQGTCDCTRCAGMDLLTKMMAVFVDNQGNLKQLTDQFMMRLCNPFLSQKFKQKQKKSNASLSLQQQFQQLYQYFIQKKTMIKQKDLKNFQVTHYFPQICDIQQQQKLPIYQNTKVYLRPADSQLKERQLKERRAEQQRRRVDQFIGAKTRQEELRQKKEKQDRHLVKSHVSQKQNDKKIKQAVCIYDIVQQSGLRRKIKTRQERQKDKQERQRKKREKQQQHQYEQNSIYEQDS